MAIVRLGVEVEDKVVMQMIGRVFVRRYAVNVEPDEHARLPRENDSGLFTYLAASGHPDRVILIFDVAARKKPAIQLRVVDQQQPLAIRGKHETRGGDVTGSKLAARKRQRRIHQQKTREFAALERGWVGGIVERFDYLEDLLDGQQVTMVARIGGEITKPSVAGGLFDLNRATSYSPT